MDKRSPCNDHWAYSVAVYSRPGVALSCLALQDSVHLDVNVLLVALWATGLIGRAVLPDEIAAADREISVWRKEVVQPLRNIRRGLKKGSFLACDQGTDGLRNLVKTSELNAERVEQKVLATWAKSLPPGSEEQEESMWVRTAERVIVFYASQGADSELGNDLIISGRVIALAAAAEAAGFAGFLDKPRRRP